MRQSAAPKLDPRFLERWSPRAFKTDSIPDADVETLFEAARFSPSCFNEQPWRLVYARSEADLAAFREVLNESNQKWANRAPLLILAFAKRHFSHNDKPNRWAGFDTGAAWMALTLQANALGLHTHAMGGYDVERAHAVTGLDPEHYESLCAIAVGYKDEVDTLTEDLREREAPSGRKARSEFVFEAKVD